MNLLVYALDTILLLPIAFGVARPVAISSPDPVVTDATNVIVATDGTFTLNANGGTWAGCLPNHTCAPADKIEMCEDGSGVWDVGNAVSIGACFYPDQGCGDE